MPARANAEAARTDLGILEVTLHQEAIDGRPDACLGVLAVASHARNHSHPVIWVTAHGNHIAVNAMHVVGNGRVYHR